MLNEISIKRIYDALGDEESRQIFCYRLFYSLTKEYKAIEAIAQKCKKRVTEDVGFKEFSEMLKTSSTLYIFGAGGYGRFLNSMVHDASWKGFIDNHPALNECNRIPIYSLHILCLSKKNFFLFMRNKENVGFQLKGGILWE